MSQLRPPETVPSRSRDGPMKPCLRGSSLRRYGCRAASESLRRRRAVVCVAAFVVAKSSVLLAVSISESWCEGFEDNALLRRSQDDKERRGISLLVVVGKFEWGASGDKVNLSAGVDGGGYGPGGDPECGVLQG